MHQNNPGPGRHPHKGRGVRNPARGDHPASSSQTQQPTLHSLFLTRTEYEKVVAAGPAAMAQVLKRFVLSTDQQTATGVSNVPGSTPHPQSSSQQGQSWSTPFTPPAPFIPPQPAGGGGGNTPNLFQQPGNGPAPGQPFAGQQPYAYSPPKPKKGASGTPPFHGAPAVPIPQSPGFTPPGPAHGIPGNTGNLPVPSAPSPESAAVVEEPDTDDDNLSWKEPEKSVGGYKSWFVKIGFFGVVLFILFMLAYGVSKVVSNSPGAPGN